MDLELKLSQVRVKIKNTKKLFISRFNVIENGMIIGRLVWLDWLTDSNGWPIYTLFVSIDPGKLVCLSSWNGNATGDTIKMI